MYSLASELTDVERYFEKRPEGSDLGADCEATGLDTRRAQLVGMSFSFGERDAIYCPVGHKIGRNVPMKETVALIKDIAEKWSFRFIFFNAKYDLNVIQRNTGWIPKPYVDALEPVYLSDPDRKRNNLKEMARILFNWDMTKFEELFTPEERKAKNYDISTKHPTRCVEYACADADAARRIWVHYAELIASQLTNVKIDTELVDVVRKIEHNGGFELNRPYIDDCIQKLEARAGALKEVIYRQLGSKFEINSPKQLGIALFEKGGIPSPGMTRGKNPQHRTDSDVMEKLAKVYPVVETVISYRKVIKARSTYFEKLKYLDERKLPVRFKFNMYAAPTFRFSAPGGDPDEDGATGVNIQAVSNGESREIQGVLLQAGVGPGTKIKIEKGDEDIFFGSEEELEEEVKQIKSNAAVNLRELAWVAESEAGPLVCFRDVCAGCPAVCKSHGIDVARRLQRGVKMIPSVRAAFRVPDGYTLVSFDYDRQEIVIGANMSKEQRWINALLNGVDLHESTAANAFQMSIDQFQLLKKKNPPDYKRKRDAGKTLNFAVFYGATAYTLANKADISKAQAELIYDAFVQGHPQLFSWIHQVHAFARSQGYTTTYFGRKRWLKEFYKSTDRKMHAFGDRSAVNTAIQGTAAEVTRIAMVKVAKAFERANLTQKEVRFLLQLHDELSFMIRNELVDQVIPLIKGNMEFKVKSWQVQLTTSPKLGMIWGQQKPIEEYAHAA